MSDTPSIEYQFEGYPEPEMQTRSAEFLKLMARRRSIRDFAASGVPIDVIQNCVEVAGQAPNGANLQPWHFVVVSDPETKHKIRLAAEAEEREFYQRRASDEWLEALSELGTDANKSFIDDAGCLIVVFAQSYGLDDQGERIKHYYVQESVGIACGFLIAALHHAGLACLTHTPSPMNFLGEILNRPANERAFLNLVVGYPNENAMVPIHATKKKPPEQFISFV